MKKLLLLGLTVALIFAATPVVAAPPQEVTIDVIQQQTRYYPDGSLWFALSPFQTSFELTLTGNVLRGEMGYSPDVTNLRGEKYTLVYDKKADVWKLNLGVIQYTSPYSGLTIKEQWEGWLELDAELNLIGGWFRQDGYVVGDPTDHYSWAVPVAGKGLWHLGYSIYTYTAP